MTSQIPDEQLQQLDSDRPLASKSSHRNPNEHQHPDINQAKQLLADGNITFTRLSEKEVQQFETFFETYMRKPSLPVKSEAVEKIDPFRITQSQDPSLVSRLEKELIEEFSLKDLSIPEDPIPNIPDGDGDLFDLETLLHTGYLEDHDSLSDLFDEIVGNEKESISNYESSVFNANVQSIFDDSDEADSLGDFPLEIPLIDDDFELPELPELPEPELVVLPDLPDLPTAPEVSVDTLTSFDFELPSVPEVTPPIDEPQIEKTPPLSPEEVVEDEKAPEAALVQTKRKKKLTLQIFDTILLLIIIIIITILVINLSDSLPFDIPFL